jgi:1,2-diacylglycerol 3-alpha-glucosyltransferase
MKICHFTNTFLPHVGGVARAVETLLEDQRRARHRVLVVAPEFEAGPAPRVIERSVVRIPAITNFNRSSFSVRIPGAALFAERLNEFPADIIHAHHPFLLGDSALREAASRQIPIVFTHHTLYEHYVHYLPFEIDTAGEIAAEIATRFANRCAAVIAPSESVRDLIVSRGVTVPIHVVPTGIDTAVIAKGNGSRARTKWKLPHDAPVIGHVGRLADEKNLPFLTEAICRTIRRRPDAHALIVGGGDAREAMIQLCADEGVAERVRFTGQLTGSALRDARAAMDLFAFASQSETQGLVLAESMAVGTPVIALDGPGVREIVRDRKNGRLLRSSASIEDFARALVGALQGKIARQRWSKGARATAGALDRRLTNQRLLTVYDEVIASHRQAHRGEPDIVHALAPVIERLVIEGLIIADMGSALLASAPSKSLSAPARSLPDNADNVFPC